MAETKKNAPAAPPAPEAKKPVWPWILSGCLVLIIIALVGIGILGWLGVRSVQNMVKQYQPTIDQTQQNIDDFNKEAQEWEKKSEQMRDSMPDISNMNVNGMQGIQDLQNAAPQQY